MIITIDGLTGTGKGTTAKGVAKQLGYAYIDTGALYRCATLLALRHDLLDAPDHRLVDAFDDVDIRFEWRGDEQRTFVDDEDVEDQIRTVHIGNNIKRATTCQPLRAKIVDFTKTYASKTNSVVDGRDGGTVVFPGADLKVFMVCDIDVRVRRRVDQLRHKGLDADKQSVRDEFERRDDHDYLGPHAQNHKADDAKVLDTTHMTIHQQIQQVIDWL